MVVNVQMTMTIVENGHAKYTTVLYSIHYERKAYTLKEATFCDSQW